MQNASIGIILVVIMLYYILGQGGKRQPQDSLFIFLLLSALALIPFEMLQEISNGTAFAGARTIHITFTLLFLLCNPLLGYFYFLYIDQMQNRWVQIPLRMGLLALIPLLVNMFFTILSLSNGMVFVIDDANIYSRGPFFFLVPFCNFVYFLGGQAHNMLHIIRGGKKMENVLSIFLPIPLIVAATVQAHMPQVEMLFLAVALTLLMTFLYNQNTHANRDYLTSLYNRSVGEQTLSYQLQQKGKGKLIGGMLMDIDGFKTINDQFGHDSGDRCLRQFAHLLTESFSRNWVVCRYGGDEFLVFGKVDSVQAMDDAIATFTKNLAHFNTENRLPHLLSVSIGKAVAEVIPTKDHKNFLKRLDEAMYLNKRNRYVVPEESHAIEPTF